MDYNTLSQTVHANAVEKGFWDGNPSVYHALMMVATEVAEVVDADRNGHNANLEMLNNDPDGFTRWVKGTVEDELADIVIRLLDLAGYLCIDFDYLTESRYFRAFERFTMTENAFALLKGLCRDNVGIAKRIFFALSYCEKWAKSLGIDLETHVYLKMAYNEKRPYRHGKKY